MFRLAWPLAAWAGAGLVLPMGIMLRVRQLDAESSRIEQMGRQVVDSSKLPGNSNPGAAAPAFKAALAFGLPSPDAPPDESATEANICQAEPLGDIRAQAVLTEDAEAELPDASLSGVSNTGVCGRPEDDDSDPLGAACCESPGEACGLGAVGVIGVAVLAMPGLRIILKALSGGSGSERHPEPASP